MVLQGSLIFIRSGIGPVEKYVPGFTSGEPRFLIEW